MNDVRPVSVSPQLARSSASKGTVDSNAETNGKTLPEVAETAKAAEALKATEKAVEQKSVDTVEVEQAVASINEYVQSLHRDLHFTVDRELDQTVVKVLDGDTGEVIRQIPDETVLELARKLNDDGEFQLINALG